MATDAPQGDEDVTYSERARFDRACGWYANTRHGMCWKLFQDQAKQMDPAAEREADAVVTEVLRTGQPPFGSWG